MKLKTCAIALIFIWLSFCSLRIVAQTKNDDEVIKVDTTLVSVPVIVSDRDGRYVSNLQARDFTLYQDGVKQNIDFFASVEEPLNVALLIDTSRSTAPVLDDIKDAAIDFIRQLQPRDRAQIVSFDYETHALTTLTNDKRQLTKAVENAEIGEFVGTTLRDALMETIDRSFKNVTGRKAIILLTDGKDANSRISVEDLMDATEESDTLVYSIFYQTGRASNFNDRRNDAPVERFPQRGGRRNGGVFGNRFPDDVFGRNFPNRRQQQRQERQRQRGERVAQKNAEAEDFLQELSEATAGRYFRSEVEDLNETFSEIIGELRYQYRLGFYPPENSDNNQAARQIRVQVARSGVVVRARRNYRLEK